MQSTQASEGSSEASHALYSIANSDPHMIIADQYRVALICALDHPLVDKVHLAGRDARHGRS